MPATGAPGVATSVLVYPKAQRVVALLAPVVFEIRQLAEAATGEELRSKATRERHVAPDGLTVWGPLALGTTGIIFIFLT